MPEETAAPPVVISKATGVTFGLLLGVVAVLGIFVGWMDSQFDDLGNRLEKIETRLEAADKDRFGAGDMRLWVAEFRGANAALSVPEPR